MTIREVMAAKLAAAKELWNQALDLDTFELPAVLTLGLLLLHAGSVWYLVVPMTVLCIAGLALRPLLVNSTYWLIIAAIASFANFRNWYSIDNHKYLTTYWCIGLYCSLVSADRKAALSAQGRWLVGLCFLFADYWKLISPDFMSGTFFKFELIADGRFSWLARTFAGIPAESAHVNALEIAGLRAWDSTSASVPLVTGTRIDLVSRVMTWWTLAIEILIAAAWLAPAKLFFARWRHALLIAFVLTTYAVANVVGFGWLLLVMGLAHCPPESRRTRGVYYACFVFLHLFLIPFRNFGGSR
jgi:hypothetical protein